MSADFDDGLARAIVKGQEGERRWALIDEAKGVIYINTAVAGTGTISITLARARQAFAAFNEGMVRLGESLRAIVRGWAVEAINTMRLHEAIHARAYWNRFTGKNMIHVYDYNLGHIWSFDPNKRIIVQAAAFASQRHQRQERVNHVDRAAWKRRRFIQQLRSAK